MNSDGEQVRLHREEVTETTKTRVGGEVELPGVSGRLLAVALLLLSAAAVLASAGVVVMAAKFLWRQL
jgi:hypothetical protein